MKRSIYFLLTGCLLLLGSCKKYLQTVPSDVLTVDDIFTSKANVDQYLANIYSSLPDEMEQRFAGSDNSGVWEGASDDAKYNWDFVYTNQMNLSVWSNTDGTVETYWSSYYQAIRNATDFMNRIGGANPNEVPDSLKVEYKAEARALRAIYYYFLLRQYGPIVLLGDNLISADASTAAVRLPRTSFDSCISFVVTQLDSAYLSLPYTPTGNQYGRMVRGVVKAYKEQALMLDASALFNGNTDYAGLKNQNGTQLISQSYDGSKWATAAAAAKAFINEFVPTYYSLFVEANADPAMQAYLSCKDVMLSDWNTEWIFAKSNAGSYMRYDRTPKHVGDPSDQQGGGAFGASQSMVDAYFMANGRTIDDPASGYVSSGFSLFHSVADQYLNNQYGLGIQAHNTYNQWVNREPRFYVGITYDSSYWLYQDNGYSPIVTSFEYSGNSGRSQSTSDVSPTGYCARKNVAANDNGRGALLLRLANIYLDYAEALNESDPGNPDILTYLNLIRQRADVPVFGTGTNALPVPADQNAMRTALHNERRVELAFENVRYFDTRRWKVAPQTDAGAFYGMNMYADGAAFYQKTQLETRVFYARDYFFPIPNNEILKDNLMVQNPGW
jgi:starch-binding outer membrane protein, SusD/RagB family